MNSKITSTQNSELNLIFTRLPAHFQHWASYLHYLTGVAVEIIVVALLAFLGLSTQDLFCVQSGNKQRCPLALYLMLLSRSGSGKSSIFKLLRVPVTQLEQELEKSYLEECEVYERHIVLWDAEFTVLNKRYKKALNQGEDITEIRKNLEECLARKPKKPVRKSIILTNPTSEALAKAIGQGYPNKAVFNDEGTGLYKGSLWLNPAFFNAYWCADKVTIDRASCESFVIENYVFSFFVMLQPQPYNNTSAQKRANIRDTGLQARTLLIDMEQITVPCIMNEHSVRDESVLHELYALMTRHLKAGVKRRENNDEFIALTLDPDATVLLNETSLSVRQQMQPGGFLEHYDDLGARFIEQSLRIAGVFQVSGDPDSTVITKENLLAALYLTEWFINHGFTKIDSTREPGDEEKIVHWLETHLVKNGSFEFRRNDILKYGPYSTRRTERLMPALQKLESKGVVQLFDEMGVNYVKFIGSKITPYELGKKTNTSLLHITPIVMSKLPR